MPTVEFDPARTLATGARFIPFPNDLARDPRTGKISLSAPMCPESATALNTRANVLNTLDGFGTYQVGLQVTFSDAVDPASIVVDPMSPDNNVVMYQVANAGEPLDPTTAMPVPLIVRSVGTTTRQLPPDCAGQTVNAVTFVPAIPLRQKSTYVVAVKSGITTTLGTPFRGSSTWGLVAAAEAPVTIDDAGNIVSDRTPLDPSDQADRASLFALNQLWTGHKPALDFLDATPLGPENRGDLLVAFAFTTQTTTDQLDPTVPTSPAGKLSTAGFAAPFQSIASDPSVYPTDVRTGCVANTDTPAECFLKLSFGSCKPFTTGCTTTNYAIGNSICQPPPLPGTPTTALPPGTYDCAQVGDILGTVLLTPNYQAQITNPLPAADGVTIGPLQGAWSDPVDPVEQGTLQLRVVATIPTGEAPADGWPVVIFGHGLTGSKTNVFTVAGRLSRMGFATVAIDFSQHGDRAVRISTEPTLGCRGFCVTPNADPTQPGTPTTTPCETTADCTGSQTCGSLTNTPSLAPPNPTDAAQCYAPIFTGDLANTRDNVRQTVLDLERLVNALKTCTDGACGPLDVDATRIYYGGVSLGSIIGTIPSAMSPDIQAAALNVGGVGFLDIIENTDAVSLRCSLVNALIDAGVLVGEKWAGGATGLCLEGDGEAWKTQPGYAQFSAIARWVLDPADPANFATRLRTKPHLIQKVADDAVVPNVSTDRQAGLTGAVLNAATADLYDPTSPLEESAAIATNPTQSKFITYTSDANATYGHSVLLRPQATTTAGFMGIWRMQIDFAQFLDNNDDNDD